jgi:hypothetical protein
VAGPLVAVCLVAGSDLITRGSIRWIDAVYCWGECRTGNDQLRGMSLFVVGLAVIVGGAVVGAGYSGRGDVGWRSALAALASVATALALLAAGMSGDGPRDDNTVFYAMARTALAVLVPPRTLWWIGAAALGAAFAITSTDRLGPAVLLGLLTVAAATSAEAYMTRPASTPAGPTSLPRSRGTGIGPLGRYLR